jgi:hypothetical protein
MKPRGLLLVALGACAAVVALALLFGRTPAGTGVRPAIGYGYVGDVELVFSQEPASVAACFGEECSPEPVTRSPDGRWLVPQSQPYLVPPVSVASINVEISDLSGARIARVLPIETESTGEYPYGKECGGPFRFKPVQVLSSTDMSS